MKITYPRAALLLAVFVLATALAFDSGNPFGDATASDVEEEAIEAVLARNRAASLTRTTAQKAVVEEEGSSFTANLREFKRFGPGPAVEYHGSEPAVEDWLETTAAIDRIEAAARATGRGWVFGWIQIAPGSDRDRLTAEWGGHGVDVLGFSGAFARVRLPGSRESIRAVATHAGVVGLGVRPGVEKIAGLMPRLKTVGEIPVLIGLMDEDPDGVWRTELEARGAVVGDWMPGARAYAANVHVDDVAAIAEAHFVATVEPTELVHALLDTAVTVMGADGLRTYDQSTGSFSGTAGARVSVGFADSGLNTAHGDIASGRDSICGRNFYPDDGEGDGDLDLWSDYEGHGTHVAGIVAGNGSARAEFAGMAPEIGHLRMAKVVNREGVGDTLTVANGVRYLMRATSCEWEGKQSDAVRPLIANFSVGGDGERNGRGAATRNIDGAVWRGSQLFVFAAGNSGSAGTTNESTAKNGLAVGAVTDAGVVTSFSSHGPTADGRLAPHVVGTGSALLSAKGNSSSTAYSRASGTSMAAPSVAGVAALLMDSDDEFRSSPAYARARLMASAVKPSPTLGSDDFPLDNSSGPGAFNAEYGLGLVSAGVAVGDGPDSAWWHGGDYGSVAAGTSHEYAIEVPENTARLDIVLTWTEPPGESLGTVVAANLDLYVDRGGDCETAACGEYASTSGIDNVEWIVVEKPAPGAYEIRIVAANDFPDPVQAGIAWTAIAETDVPGLAVSATDSEIDIGSGDAFKIQLEVSTAAYVAAGTTLHMACRSEDASVCERYEDARWRPLSEVDRGDGTVAGVGTPVTGAVPLGEIRVSDEQRVVLVAPRDVAKSSHTLYFIASSWNATSGRAVVDVLVGGRDVGTHATRPVNDGVARAVALEGESGEATFDLLLATREPGEPMMREDRRPGGKKLFFESRLDEDGYDEEMEGYARHGSVWFSIAASRSGPYRLSVEPDSASEDTWITVYEGSNASDATRIAEDEGVAEFIANSKGAYLVQVWSSEATRHPLRLAWNQYEDVRPKNDDFADRKALSGLRGVVEGTNYRATLEGFEFYGVRMLGESTWYRWVAPRTGRFGLSFPSDFEAIVFTGSEAESLRRISTMPGDYDRAQFLAKRDQEYQIVVLDYGERLIPNYHLSWHPVEGSVWGYAENDTLADATTVEGESGSDSISWYRRATVGPDEDARTGVGTRWWQWRAPGDGRYVFRLTEGQYAKIAAFAGKSLEDIEFVADGKSVLVDAEEDDRYWFSVGFRYDHMFADLDASWWDDEFSWGPMPENDTPATAVALAGESGNVSADHTYATTSSDEPDGVRGHSSLWWRWEAPSTGWQRFALDDWESLGHEEPTQQSILAIYRQPDGGSLEAIATSDHSYIASGRAEAVFRGEAGEEYLVRVALRATDLEDWSRQTAFSYEPVGASPAWQRYAARLVETGGHDDETEDGDLVAPKSLAVAGESGLVVVAARNGLLAYAESADGALSRSATVPYETEGGAEVRVSGEAVLHWDAHESVLYLVQQNAIFAVRGLGGGAKHLERCASTGADGVVPAQVARDAESENLYVVGSGRIDVYAGTTACEFELIQVLDWRYRRNAGVQTIEMFELYGARSLVVGPGGGRAYVASDDGLLVFARGETGRLSHQETLSASDWLTTGYDWDWDEATLVRGGAGVLFFVAPESPRVAAFRIDDGDGGDAEQPELLGVVEGFFLDENDRPTFYSHVAWPFEATGCSASTAQDAEGPAVDVLCDGQVLTVRWDGDEKELFVADWFQVGQADRFGGLLRDGLRSVTPARIAESSDGGRNYVLGEPTLGTLHVFDRASKITTDPYAD